MLKNKDFVHNTVRCKSWKWYFFPRSFDRMVAINPYVYTSKPIRDMLMSDHNSLDLQLEFVHAMEHLHQQKQMGTILWLLSFMFNRSFRERQELEAIHSEMKFLKKNSFVFEIDKASKRISGKGFFNMMTYDEAKVLLNDMWQQI